MTVANSRWLMKIVDGVGSGFRTSKISIMTNGNCSAAVIVGKAHVVEKKSTVFDIRSALDLLINIHSY